MKSFIIPSLLVAGFSDSSPDILHKSKSTNKLDFETPNFWNLMDRTLPITLAGHSSHASHGSHGSHGSHSSSSAPTPRYVPTPTPPPKAAPKKYAPPVVNNSTTPESVLPKIAGNSVQFKRIAMRVQMYLYAFGFYNGTIDGKVGMDTQAAIIKFQDKRGLKVTGKVDNELLKVMNVSTE